MAHQTVPPAQKGGEGQPQSPLDLKAPDWKETLRRTVAEFKADRAALISAGMAFERQRAIKRGQLDAGRQADDERPPGAVEEGGDTTAKARTQASTAEWAERMKQLRNR